MSKHTKPTLPDIFRTGAVTASPGGPADTEGLHIFADGCCEPNSGAGGWAFVVYRDGAEIASEMGSVERAANNAMELLALLRAAEWISLNSNAEPAVIWSDSAYAVNGCNSWRHIWKNRGWRKKGPGAKARARTIADPELWQAIDRLLTDNPSITVAWCKGHSGIPGNERADELASRRPMPAQGAGEVS